MARTSRQSSTSKQNFLAATSLRPNKSSRDLSLADQLIETRLRSEQAKLTLLEAGLPNETDVKYMRYEDMPPPSPEQEAEFYETFKKLVGGILDDGVGPETGQTLQDWLIEQGAIIPDLPEWKTPLYLEKF